MARGDQLARQWRIIQTLVASKHGKTVADLVQEENCHPRTIYRDLKPPPPQLNEARLGERR